MAHPRTVTGPRARARPAAPARAALVAVLVLLATVGFALPAAAHASLVGSDPADGATLATAPARVTLTFDDALEDFGPVVTVTGPDGNQYQSGDAVVDGVTLSTAVQSLPAAGTYTVAYRVVSDDGHPVEGQLRFELTAAPATPVSGPSPSTGSSQSASPIPITATSTPGTSTGTAGPATTSAPGTPAPITTPVVTTDTGAAAASLTGGTPVWPWLVLALVAVLAVGTVLVLRRRRAAGAADPDGPPAADR
ncbi:copper resistance CopC family protein [Nakamurella sp.]|uniref:copper resistance CopC family protein n=1 Tax=Nakamurella sp. TaxID=1869182 RepID=UPI003B3A0438